MFKHEKTHRKIYTKRFISGRKTEKKRKEERKKMKGVAVK